MGVACVGRYLLVRLVLLELLLLLLLGEHGVGEAVLCLWWEVLCGVLWWQWVLWWQLVLGVVALW